ncbi:MAG: type 4a pilus biogenesis protein PilO [Deltaproteobacteria bacterium]|nr:type 4a pilus biogenesis protein PilO [Deltaproteobacteria bacterium]MBZ0219126.1 type 4a pilus biogenesis protein PilO [Deltaproteobacteria bacterium]
MDRKKAYRYAACIAVPIAVIILALFFYGRYADLKRSAVAASRDLASMEALRGEYLTKKSVLDSMAAKAAPSGESAVAVVEGIARRTGISGKIKSIKPLEEKADAGYAESPVEARLEGVDMNELVNFLYQAEHGDRLVVVKELSIKERFEDRDLVDAVLRVSLISKQ